MYQLNNSVIIKIYEKPITLLSIIDKVNPPDTICITKLTSKKLLKYLGKKNMTPLLLC